MNKILKIKNIKIIIKWENAEENKKSVEIQFVDKKK